MRKLFLLLIVFVMFGCSSNNSNEVVVYSSKENKPADQTDSSTSNANSSPNSDPSKITDVSFSFDLSSENWLNQGIIQTDLPNGTKVDLVIHYDDIDQTSKTLTCVSYVDNSQIKINFDFSGNMHPQFTTLDLSVKFIDQPDEFFSLYGQNGEMLKSGYKQVVDGKCEMLMSWNIGLPSSLEAFQTLLDNINAKYDYILTSFNLDSNTKIWYTSLNEQYADQNLENLSNELYNLLLISSQTTDSQLTTIKTLNHENTELYEFKIQPKETATQANEIVYVSQNGSKYHLGQCSSLRSEPNAITLNDALAKGYELCKICAKKTN